ncbi:MAG: ribonuclease H-like domain-containing protein [Cytophagales bacterium]|nr:ribonuclease H-like domain-containing protein [Cytophagales bacterium]MDW8385204.1 ribonuclease H-like domain-containing protein [Flammeovirgaceae bacterium]
MEVYKSLQNLLFIDIETVAQHPSFEEVDAIGKRLWEQKSFYINENFTPQDLYTRAGIYAEFGKIICIGVAFFHLNKEKKELELRVKALSNKNEKELLTQFKELIGKFDEKKLRLIAHNGKEFDFPYLSRRMIVNEIPLPVSLDLSGKKPWEIPHLDTLELWRFGDRKHYTSLELLAYCLGISAPQSELSKSLIHDTYYKEDNIPKIVENCINEVILIAQIFLKMNFMPLLSEHQIIKVK